jgi:diguanylate cyclase (GGDEF)-like protein
MRGEMVQRIAHWLCPSELDRSRMLDSSPRMQRARLITAGAVGVALIYFAPEYGWWTLVLFAVALVNLLTLDRRIASSAHPELHVASSLVVMEAILAGAVALSGGPTSPALPWLVFPAAFSAIRFRGSLLFVFVGLAVAMMLAATAGVDPAGFWHHPVPVLIAAVLMVGVTSCVYTLNAAEAEQREGAGLDHLTGLLNRTSLQLRFDELVQQASLFGEAVSVILLDLDHFKRINDDHGHGRGDAVLREVAYTLRRQLRSFELVYRVGGEELLVLLPGTGLLDAAGVAERLRRAIVAARPGGLEVTASFGVAQAHEGATLMETFDAADTALYAAKTAGRDCVRVAGAAEAATLAEAA